MDSTRLTWEESGKPTDHLDSIRPIISRPPLALRQPARSVSSLLAAILPACSRIALAFSSRPTTALVATRARPPTLNRKIATTTSISVYPVLRHKRIPQDARVPERRVIRPKRVKPKRRVHKKKTGERNSAPPFSDQLNQTQ